ncbi:MAG: molybdate ABC transporter substrate-binding protein [Deltaproteobacteria bacterium HGW-Deltaproteobacteria-19]|jgi:molybdate transport system substrate-binding protein|nr:MAG: molybdate ABC transporter substrate-binding protein [Deltaproteobacteria bacterium HGW-Deltaproteobacteria-19]
MRRRVLKSRLLLTLFTLFTLLVTVSMPSPVCSAEPLRVAVAANFQQPFKDIAAAFTRETGIPVEGVFSSSGSLYHQITNGAPYDAFLSADETRPADLFKKSFSGKPFVYATGSVVLWAEGKKFCGAANWREVMKRKDVQKVAIANPVVAPYGAAAEAALRSAGLWNNPDKKWITGQTIAQAFQYTATGGADVGFCALSSVRAAKTDGCHYDIAEAPPIRQGACLLNRTKNRTGAERFLQYLQSPAAEAVKKKYGYR